MLRSLVVVSLWLVLNPQYSHGDEMIYTINGKRALHKVNERFLSFSVDPAVLLTGFNLSESSLQLARHLSPAFVRLAGPSTRFVKYVETDDGDAADDNIMITTPMWFGVNAWLISANLTPIFGINDNDNIEGGWNPKSILPLLEISDKLNVTCFWQLGYDCSNKSEYQYKEDLLIFRHLLDAFPDKKNTWKIIGSDLSNCIGDNVEFLDHKRRTIDDLNGVVEAIILEQSSSNAHPFSKLLSNPFRPKIPLWTTTPKSPQSITFLSAINWLKEIGEAARVGYQVVFRQPRYHELFSDTPVYWVSVLYKMLMGRTVLEMKPSGIYPDLSVYAHCTKTQNNFVRSGAVTILLINNSTQNSSILVNFGNPFLRNTEVQSFILTAPQENSKDVYLNGEKLGIDHLQENNLNFLPKLRLAKIFNYLSISIPPKSIGFFVLPVAHLTVCSSEEADLNSIVEEIRHDQNINFSDKTSIELIARHQTAQSSLKDLKETLQKEVETDEEFYKKPSLKYQLPKRLFSNGRDYFLERQKFNENYRKYLDMKRSKEKPTVVNDRDIHDDNDDNKEVKNEKPIREVELELTSAEIRKILADRAKKKAAKKNIIFTSEELDEILEKATEKFLKNGNTAIKIKRKTKRSPVIDKKITKRDINLELLKQKTEFPPNIKNNKMWKNYIMNSKIRESLQPKELLDSSENNDNTKTEVFVEMANSKELTTTSVSPMKIKKIKLPELLKWKPLVPSKLTTQTFDILKPATYQFTEFKLPQTTPTTTTQTTNNGKYLDEFQTARDNNDVVVDDNNENDDFSLSQDLTNFDCIHEYFGQEFDNIDNVNYNKNNTNDGLEFGELFGEFNENKENKLPELMSRGNKPQKQSDEDGFNVNDFDFDYGELDDIVDDNYDDDCDDEESILKWKRSINEIDENLSDTRKQRLNQRLLNQKESDSIGKNHKYLNRNRRQILPVFQQIIENLPIFNRWKQDESETNSKDVKERSKRYIANDIDSFENDIDNENDKKNRGSKLIIMKMKQRQEQEQQMKNDRYKIEFSDNIHDSDKNKSENNETSNKISVNDKKIDNKCKSGNIWEQVMHGMAEILQNLTGKFKHYIKHLMH